MFVFTSSFALIISMLISNVDSNSEATKNLTNEISSINLKIEEFQMSLGENNPSNESLVQIVKDLSSTLTLIISHLESSKSFENVIDTKMQNLHSEMEELRKDVNETECSLSIRIIDIENDISKLEKQPKIAFESQTNSSIENTALLNTNSINQRKRITDSEFFLTPSLMYLQARMHCLENGGTPFVPKTKEEYFYVVGQVTAEENFGWLPLADILVEGVAEWEDGTSYEDGPIHFKFTDIDETNGNAVDRNCVDVNRNAEGDWFKCSERRHMLCIVNEGV